MPGAAGVECLAPLCPPVYGCAALGGRKGSLDWRLAWASFLPSEVGQGLAVGRAWSSGAGVPSLEAPKENPGWRIFCFQSPLKILSAFTASPPPSGIPKHSSSRWLVDVGFFPHALPLPEAHAQETFMSGVFRGEFWTGALAWSRRVAYLRYLVTAGASFLEGNEK